MSNSFGQGYMVPVNGTSEVERTQFLFDRAAARIRTLMPVKVIKVYTQSMGSPTQGAIAGAGFVDVQPMVSQVDGGGTSMQHSIIYGIPYTRMYGGSNAVIMDPVQNDIGYIICADRDISSFVQSITGQGQTGGIGGVQGQGSPSTATGGPGTSGPGGIVPPSQRRFSPSDAIYIGGMLNQTPKQVVTFTANGITISDMNNNVISMGPGGVSITCSGSFSVTASNAFFSGAVVAGHGSGDQVGVQTHMHSGVTVGSGNTAAPVAGT